MSEIPVQILRLHLAGIKLAELEEEYLKAPDDLGVIAKEESLPDGYKRCGGCSHGLKFYLFNVNKESKNGCTGNCKACQKASAKASYDKNKSKRDYKQYYAEHKEAKLAHSKRIYKDNKEAINAKLKAYHATPKGKKVMKKAHAKRRKNMAANQGIAYKREWVIDRDKMGSEFPICYMCNLPITVERNMHKDHVVPILLGGADCFTNVAMVHALCNLQKEKDARKLTAEQVEGVIKRAEEYIDSHPELFQESEK